MKKLLILAVLALGLCASPALAESIDFSDPRASVGYGAGTILMGNDSGILFYAHNIPGGGIDTSVIGGSMAAYLLPSESLELIFVADLNNEVYGSAGTSSVSFTGEGLTYKAYLVDGGLTPDSGSVLSAGLQTIDISAYNLDSIFLVNNSNEELLVLFHGIEWTNPASNPVPVPAAVWLLGTGVAGVAALRRKFK